MAKDEKAQSSPPSAASTVALENLAESIARATLRALDERQLAAVSGKGIHLPIGDGTTVLGILIPCRPGGEDPWGLGLGPCHHHIFGIIIIPKPGEEKPVETVGNPVQATLKQG